MLDDNEFSELMRKIRAGDQDAARQLVESYEPEIRRAARLRMTDPQLRRLVDSIDICQSVFGRFSNAPSLALLKNRPNTDWQISLESTSRRN